MPFKRRCCSCCCAALIRVRNAQDPALTSRGNAAVLAAIIPMKRRRIIQMRSNVRQPPGASGAHGSRRPMIGIDRTIENPLALATGQFHNERQKAIPVKNLGRGARLALERKGTVPYALEIIA